MNAFTFQQDFKPLNWNMQVPSRLCLPTYFGPRHPFCKEKISRPTTEQNYWNNDWPATVLGYSLLQYIFMRIRVLENGWVYIRHISGYLCVSPPKNHIQHKMVKYLLHWVGECVCVSHTPIDNKSAHWCNRGHYLFASEAVGSLIMLTKRDLLKLIHKRYFFLCALGIAQTGASWFCCLWVVVLLKLLNNLCYLVITALIYLCNQIQMRFNTEAV